MASKIEISSGDASKTFPAFPVVLVAMGEGEKNVFTVGLVQLFSFNPLILGIGVHPSRHSYKMLHNLADFSVNIPGKELVEQVLYCGTKSGKDTDKFKETGLTAVPGKKIRSPVISECLVNFECKKSKALEMGDRTWFFGEVVHVEAVEGYTRDKGMLYWGGEFRMPGEIFRRR
ncbi:MAG: flavin reductase family protein [Methanomassiliicoccales archaeon]|nr:flavin reductase family protein [Methanomassiliicoccales archaeon]